MSDRRSAQEPASTQLERITQVVGRQASQPHFDQRTLAARVRSYLEDEIVSNRLSAGSPLVESEIAGKLGVSRAPVREALHALQGDGLVEAVARRGAYVASLTVEDVRDTYEVRADLEAMVMRRALARLSDEDLATLDRQLAVMERAAANHDVHAYFSANVAFHEVFLSRCGSPIIQTLYSIVSKHSVRFRYSSLSLPTRLAESFQDHQTLNEVVRSGDAETAAQVARAHVRSAGAALLVALPELISTPSEAAKTGAGARQIMEASGAGPVR